MRSRVMRDHPISMAYSRRVSPQYASPGVYVTVVKLLPVIRDLYACVTGRL